MGDRRIKIDKYKRRMPETSYNAPKKVKVKSHKRQWPH